MLGRLQTLTASHTAHMDSASEAWVALSNLVLRLVAATVIAAGILAGTILQALTRPFPALVASTEANQVLTKQHHVRVCACTLNATVGPPHLLQQQQARRDHLQVS
jgi:hypothetical protein